MIKSNLKNLAYLFYPKKIDNILDKENYLKTYEYKKNASRKRILSNRKISTRKISTKKIINKLKAE